MKKQSNEKRKKWKEGREGKRGSQMKQKLEIRETNRGGVVVIGET